MDPLVERVASYVKQKFDGEGSGHDWWHIHRVWQMAKHIGAKEGTDMRIVELGALLHDIADWKFHNGDDMAGSREARRLLTEFEADADCIDRVCGIVEAVSYKGAGVTTDMATLEGKVVQDADRLDAIGAIGIARAFAYGGHTGRLLYDPAVSPVLHQTKEAYFNGKSTTLNHFYEKLLLLKDRLQTDTGKQIAEDRHRFMEEYVNRFLQEWDGQI